VEAFHHICATNKLNVFLPSTHPLWEASMPSTQRRTAAQLKVPEPPQVTVIGLRKSRPKKKKRGRPIAKTAETTDIMISGETR